MGTRALMSGDYRTAQEQLEESVSVWRAVGDPWSLFHPLNTLGDLARIQGDYAAADRYYQESLGLLDQVGVKADRSSVLHNLGLVALGQGDPSRARHLFAEALTLFDELGDLRGMVESLTGLAGALADTRPDDAARVIAAGTRALQEAGQQITPWNRVDYDRIVAGVRGRLTEERWSEVWQSGQAMDIPEAMRLALAEASGC
jgi:tetratricopeptide (TPR) repeat protein